MIRQPSVKSEYNTGVGTRPVILREQEYSTGVCRPLIRVESLLYGEVCDLEREYDFCG